MKCSREDHRSVVKEWRQVVTADNVTWLLKRVIKRPCRCCGFYVVSHHPCLPLRKTRVCVPTVLWCLFGFKINQPPAFRYVWACLLFLSRALRWTPLISLHWAVVVECHKLTKHPDITGCGETSEVDGFRGHPLDRQPSNRRCKEMGDVGIMSST